MTVAIADTKLVKSQYVTNTDANGGRASHVEIISGAKNNLFPRVTKAERISGITRYRKMFWRNMSPDDESAEGVMAYLNCQTNGGDRVYIGSGTQTNVQSEWTASPPIWTGCGDLSSVLSGGETEIDIDMESDDFAFKPGGFIHISDNVSTGQTIGSSVRVGDSVQESGGTWNTIPATQDITHPKGYYLGSDKVLTNRDSTSDEFIELQTYLTEDEVIGTGSTGDTSPALSTLAEVSKGGTTMGIVAHTDYLPTVTAICGGVSRTVTVGEDGTCSGYCTAGELNMDDGTWTTEITWTTAPDDGEDITIDYYTKNYVYSGNTVTVHLLDTVANSYATANTIVSGCVGDPTNTVEPTVSDWTENATDTGTYDESTYPLVMYCDGTEEDTWTLTFTGSAGSPSTNYSVSGSKSGSVGNGNTSSNFSPTNPETGQPFFTLNYLGFGGNWNGGDTITFKTKPSAFPVILKEVVPSGTIQEPRNFFVVGNYWE